MAAPSSGSTSRCEPQPLPPNSKSYWVSDLESNLFQQWNEMQRQKNAPSGTSLGDASPSASASSLYTNNSTSNFALLYGRNNVGNAAGSNSSQTLKTLRIENGFDDPKSSPSASPVSNPHDYCQSASFPQFRSTGVPYNGAPIVHAGGGGPMSLEDPSLTIPFGIRYHVKLQNMWSTLQNPNVQPNEPPRRSGTTTADSSDSDELSYSLVLDIVNSTDSAPFLHPIPLTQMLEVLHPIWEEEGLVDLARSRETAGKPRP